MSANRYARIRTAARPALNCLSRRTWIQIALQLSAHTPVPLISSAKTRPNYDVIVVEEAKTGGGKIIHYESEVGGNAILNR